jgi:membrane protease YdiL (CAAX protease family)
VLDLAILSLGLLIHMFALPYSFKNLVFDSIVRLVQIAFGIAILATLQPEALQPTPAGLIAGGGVGAAFLLFQIVWNRGMFKNRFTVTGRFIASQLVILFFQVPGEEIFYRGVFFTVLASIWGPFTALVISTALSTMIAVVSSRKQVIWLGAGLLGILCCLGFYWSQSIWAPVLIHVFNDFGYVTLGEKRDIFT